jgi:deoxyhypusine synthase
MIGGGVPKNFMQDTVVAPTVLGIEAEDAQVRRPDHGGRRARRRLLVGSTLKEANSWGKVDTAIEQMVFAEATLVLPLMVSDAWHRGAWKQRVARQYNKLLASSAARA